MPFHLCVSGCGRYLAPGDGHDRCLMCLGTKHTLADESCSHCGKMTISELRTRLRYLQGGGAPLPLPRSTSGSSTGGLRVTVVATPPGNQPAGDYRSSSALQPVELPKPSSKSIPRYPSVLLPTTGCQSLHRRESSPERKIRLSCHPLGWWQDLNWIRR